MKGSRCVGDFEGSSSSVCRLDESMASVRELTESMFSCGIPLAGMIFGSSYFMESSRTRLGSMVLMP
jgi:hypothetical protein